MSKPFSLGFFVLLCAAVSAEAAAVPEQRDCGEDFRSKLRELMEIKGSCPSAFYESCCQVTVKMRIMVRRSSGITNSSCKCLYEVGNDLAT